MLCYVIIVCACHCNCKLKNEMTLILSSLSLQQEVPRYSPKRKLTMKRSRYWSRLSTLHSWFSASGKSIAENSEWPGKEAKFRRPCNVWDIASFLVHYCLQHWRVARGLGMRLTVGCKLCCHYSSFHSIILYMLYNKYKIQLKTHIIIYQKDS